MSKEFLKYLYIYQGDTLCNKYAVVASLKNMKITFVALVCVYRILEINLNDEVHCTSLLILSSLSMFWRLSAVRPLTNNLCLDLVSWDYF